MLPIEQGFLHYIEQISPEYLENYVNQVYEALSKANGGRRPGFGEDGSKEFAAALLLGEFDKNIVQDIVSGLNMVFQGKWGPLDFSNYMDEVVNQKAVISYPFWSATYRHVESHHKWIQNHASATEPTRISISNPLNSL